MTVSNQHVVHLISIEIYLNWKIYQTWLPLGGRGSMDGVAPPPTSEYLKLIQELFFWNFGVTCTQKTSLQSYRCPQARSSTRLPNLQSVSSGGYGWDPQVAKLYKRLYPCCTFLKTPGTFLFRSPAMQPTHHPSWLQGCLPQVETKLNASFLVHLSSKSLKFLYSLCCNRIFSQSFSHSAFFFDHFSSIPS